MHVALRPEQPNLALRILIGLHAFVTLHGVVQRRIEAVHLKGLQWLDFGSSPSPLAVPVDCEHIIGVLRTEREILSVELG